MLPALHRQHEVLEKEGRKVVPSGKPGFLVDRPSLLSSGRITDGPNTGDLLVTEPFEEEQCGLLLGWGQRPAIELLVECCRETVHQITRLAAPAARFCFGHGEPVGKVDRFSLNGSSTPKDEDHPTSYENRPDQSYQEDAALRYDVRKSRPFLEIGKDIDGGENSHYQEGHKNAGEESALRYEVRILQVL